MEHHQIQIPQPIEKDNGQFQDIDDNFQSF